MKFSFKRILSSALAAVMAASVMSVGMVSSVMAAAHEWGTVVTEGQTKTWTFTGAPAEGITKSQDINEGDSVNGIIFKQGTGGTNKYKANSNKPWNVSIFKGATMQIPVPANSTGTLSITPTGSDESRSLHFTDGTEDKSFAMHADTEVSQKFTAAATSTGYITLTPQTTKDTDTSAEYKIGTIKVTLDAGFTFDGSDEPKPTPVELQPLEAGTYGATEIVKGAPNFDLTGTTGVSGTSVKPKNGETIKFKVNANATVEVTYKCGSSTPNKTAKLKITNGSTSVEGPESKTDNSDPEAGKGTAPLVTVKATGLEGEVTLTPESGDTTAQITEIKVSYDGTVEEPSSETSSEDVSEESSEPSSEDQPDVPADGCVAVPYNIKFDQTTGNAAARMEAAGVKSLKSGKLDNITYELSADYSLKDDGSVSANVIKVKNGSIKFSTNKSIMLTVVVNGADADHYIEIKNADGTGDPLGSFGVTTEAVLLQPGSYTLVSGGKDTSISEIDIAAASNIASTKKQVPSDDDDYYAVDAANSNTYIIHTISAADAAAATTLALKDAPSTTSTNTVYAAVKFADGSQINASDFGADTYIYAVRVTGTEGAAPKSAIEWVTAE